jgi:uncharacterized metal-binding protein YceD (DUF177 family)
MTRTVSHPLSRPLSLERLRRDGTEVTVEATPAECAGLAADFKIPAIRDLLARFTVNGPPSRLLVTGTVRAVVTQVCTVSLEPFETEIAEPVEVAFTDTIAPEDDDPEDLDAPDPIVGGRIDFGTLAAEFVALGLDPYPRKPGVDFEPIVEDADEPALAALRRLRPEPG